MSIFGKKEADAEVAPPTMDELVQMKNELAHMTKIAQLRGLYGPKVTEADLEAIIEQEELRARNKILKVEADKAAKIAEEARRVELHAFVVTLINKGVLSTSIDGKHIDNLKTLKDLKCPSCGAVLDATQFLEDIANALKYAQLKGERPINRMTVQGYSTGCGCTQGVAAFMLSSCPYCRAETDNPALLIQVVLA